MEKRARSAIIRSMKSTRLHLSGISTRRLILLPEERQAEARTGRPRIRRYRLGVLAGQLTADAPARTAKIAPPALARAVRP